MSPETDHKTVQKGFDIFAKGLYGRDISTDRDLSVTTLFDLFRYISDGDIADIERVYSSVINNDFNGQKISNGHKLDFISYTMLKVSEIYEKQLTDSSQTNLNTIRKIDTILETTSNFIANVLPKYGMMGSVEPVRNEKGTLKTINMYCEQMLKTEIGIIGSNSREIIGTMKNRRKNLIDIDFNSSVIAGDVVNAINLIKIEKGEIEDYAPPEIEGMEADLDSIVSKLVQVGKLKKTDNSGDDDFPETNYYTFAMENLGSLITEGHYHAAAKLALGQGISYNLVDPSGSSNLFNLLLTKLDSSVSPYLENHGQDRNKKTIQKLVLLDLLLHNELLTEANGSDPDNETLAKYSTDLVNIFNTFFELPEGYTEHVIDATKYYLKHANDPTIIGFDIDASFSLSDDNSSEDPNEEE